jgi:hypothetical protein
MTTTTKWIDLRDHSTNGRLKVTTRAEPDGRNRTYLFVVGMAAGSPRWKNAIEKLGFVESPNKKYLVRMVGEGERITARMFTSVWPQAVLAEMNREDVYLDLAANRKVRETPRTEEEAQAAAEVGEIIRLGRNLDGDEVFQSTMGRFIRNEKGDVHESGALLGPALFLRNKSADDLAHCADGFVQSMVMGEVQHSDDFERFLRAITDKAEGHSQEVKNLATEAIEASALRFLERLYDTAQDAYGDSARLYEYMPPYQGAERGKGAMPLPLAVMAQRLLGDTSDKGVVYPNAFDGASFAFLPQGTRIRAFRGVRDLSKLGSARKDVEWADQFEPAREQASDAMFINMDPGRVSNGTRSDYSETLNALRILNPGGRAVVVLAADPSEQPGQIGHLSRGFYDTLSRRYQIEAAFEIPAAMTSRVGTNTPLRVLALRNRAPSTDAPMLVEFPVKFSWDEVKSHVDEAIVTIDLKEAETQSIDVERVANENDFQRPYLAFSKVGEARTMVPKNLQAPLQAALSNLERIEGPIDTFVERELGFGANTLGDRFSPEQVDAIGLSVFRMKSGRAPIIGDETGIGKGRTLSGLATWAEKNGKSVIFVTDRSNLFSDLARDLRDIGEWGRFKPIIMNADGVVMDVFTGEILTEGTPAAEMRAIMESGRSIQDVGANMVLCTYSQIAGEDSPKAEWLLNQATNSLVIVDEAHIAAGSDSNMSRVVLDLVTRAWATAYSSATWAKSSENLHIYSRALPETINIASLSRTMKTGGEAFAETFSSMLARDGALIRREHDLSKLEFGVEVDTTNLDRNNKIADQVAEVLGAMTYVGGEINRLLMRSNNDTINALKAARNARTEVVAAIEAAKPAKPRGRGRARTAEAQPAEAAQAAPVAQGEGAAAPAEPVAETQTGPLVTGRMFRSSFGAGTVLYQVMRRLLALLNVDNVAEKALAGLAVGEKPVIVFEETGETFVKAVMDSMTLPGIDGERAILPEAIPVPTIKDLLYRVVNRMGALVTYEVDETYVASATQLADEEIDVEGVVTGEATRGVLTVKVEDLPGMSESARASYTEGMRRIVELIDKLPPLPLNAIDLLRARLESAGLRVGEISGRRVALNVPEAHRDAAVDSNWTEMPNWSVSFRKRGKPELNKTVYGFNHGELDALLINRSAAAGISLHASPRFSDRRRRLMLELQIPENPTDRIQLYGRVNRYDQVVGPRIGVASTGVYGETRQLMMQNKKLARLSANTRSSRENAVEIKHVIDLLNPVGESVCRKFLEDNGGIRQRLGITEQELENSGFSAASRLTSRLVLLKVAEQKMVYEELYEAFDEEVLRLDLAGENPLRAKEMDIRASTIQERIAIGVDMEGLGSAFDGPVYIKEIEWKEDRKPIEWTDLKARIKTGRDKLLSAGLAVLGNPRQEPVLLQSSEIDWENDVWTVGQKANEAAKKMLDERESKAALEAMERPLSAVAAGVAEAFKADEMVGVVHGRLASVAPRAEDIEALAESFRRVSEIHVNIDTSAMVQRLAQILDAKARIELVGTKYADLNAALGDQKDNAIKRAWARKVWVEEHLAALVPGATMTISESRRVTGNATPASDFFQRTVMVTGLIPPPKGKDSQLQRWKVEYVQPGDEKPRSVSLAALLEDLKLTNAPQEGGGYKTDVIGGPIIQGYAFDGQNHRAADIREQIVRSARGVRRRTGHVLDGNLYLASEWAQATKNGYGVVYTDDRGVRHRAVMLKERILGGAADVFNHLPVRLWNRQMLRSLVKTLWTAPEEIPTNFSGSVNGYLMPTDFTSAMNQGGDADKSQFLVIPGVGVAMTMERKDIARVSRALKSEIKAITLAKFPNLAEMTEEERARALESLPKVTTSAKRGAKPIVTVNCASQEGVETAIDMLCKAVGLEVYVWPHSALGQTAQRVVEGYFTDRREAARALRAVAASNVVELRAEVAQPQEEQEPQREQELRRA